MDEQFKPAKLTTSVLSRTTIADVPEWIAQAGNTASFAFDEFFYGQLRNPFTRKAYLNAIHRFAKWCEGQTIDLVHVMPGDLGRYLDSLTVAPPTRKLHLAALRRFFDELVLRHVIVLNPALSVRSQRHQAIEGKTPEISIEHIRRLLRSIDTSNLVGQRDRTIIEILIYTAARVGAVAKLRRADFYEVADQYYLRFNEKGGKIREIPARHDLQRSLQEYLESTRRSISETSNAMFSTAIGRTKRLTNLPMTADDMSRMVKRRFSDAGLSERLSPHSFRVTTITDLLNQGVPLSDVQYLAGHSDPRTTQLYDRRQRRVTRNIVERISV